MAQHLYDAIEKDIGAKMIPSGTLTDEGYHKIWRKRDPEAVKYHRRTGFFYHSAARIQGDILDLDQDIKKAEQILAKPKPMSVIGGRQYDDAQRNLGRMRREQDKLNKIWDELPAEAKTPEALKKMFS